METLQARLALHHPDTIAHRVGVTRQAVDRWRDGSIPRKQYRRALARVLGIPKNVLEAEIDEARVARLRSRHERTIV